MNKKRTIQALAIVFTLVALAGCQSGNQNQSGAEATTSSASPANSSSGQPNSSSGQPALRHRTEASTESQPPARSEPQTQTVPVPAGTEIHIRLSSAINTSTATPGSRFQGSLAEPLIVNGIDVASRGSLVSGRITNVVSSGRLNRPAELSLMLTSITPEGGQATAVSTQTYSVSGKSHKKRNIEMAGGGAGLGAVIGAIAGGGKGAAIGGLVGAAAGTGGAYATGKKEIELPAETGLTFKLSAPATFTVSTAG
ncbi:MAG: hypothetical protein M1404_00385 [Acidobacteria bacterium]|nr:hypothetical protein [Acidobacteriota bacterium]